MKDISGKMLGAGVGGSLGFTMNSIDKNGKGPSYPEVAINAAAAFALYNFATERELKILENCAIGFAAYTAIRATNIGRPKVEHNNSLNGTPVMDIAKSNAFNPETLQGVGVALKGLSSVLTAFKS